MPGRLHRTALVLFATLALWPTVGWAQNYHALVVSAGQPDDSLLLRQFEVNGEKQLLELGKHDPTVPLTKKQYEKLHRLSLREVLSFRLSNGLLRARSRDRGELLVLPRKFRRWPRRDRAPLASIVEGIRLTGKEGTTGEDSMVFLDESQVVFVFAVEPSDDSVAFAVTEVKDTEQAYEAFAARFPQSPHVVQAREKLAVAYLQHAVRALEQYEKALEGKTVGYHHLGEAREWFSRLQTLGVAPEGMNQTEARLARHQDLLEGLLADARRALEGAEFARAGQILEPIRHFRNEFPRLREELNAVREAAYQYYLHAAAEQLAKLNFDGAVEQTRLAAEWKNDDAIAAMKKQIATARQAHRRSQEIQQAQDEAREAVTRRDYLAAFQALRPAAMKYPEEDSLRRNLATVRQSLRAHVLSRTREVERTYTPLRRDDVAGERQVMDLYLGLAALAAAEPGDREVVDWRDIMGDYLSDYYYTRAKALAPATEDPPSALAYAYLQQAALLALGSKRERLIELPRWRPQVEDNLRLRLLLRVQDSTTGGEARGLAVQLQRLLAIELQSAELPQMEILDPRTAPALNTQNTLELRIDLARASVRDERKTESIESSYVAGQRQEANPDWEQAKSEYDQAVERFSALRARSTRGMSKKEREAHQQELSQAQAEMEAAKRKLDTSPAYVPRDDVRSYQFSRNAVTRVADLEATYQWINQGKVLGTDLARQQETAEGMEISGVEETDSNGHRNQSPDLPENSQMLDRALQELHGLVVQRFLSFLANYLAADIKQAQRLRQQSNPERAAEYYLRFLFNSRRDDPRRAEALAFLKERFNLITLAQWMTPASGAAGISKKP